MKDSCIRVASAFIDVSVADTFLNAQKIIEKIDEAERNGANLLVFPELSVTGYTCGDLFFSNLLIDSAIAALQEICKSTCGKSIKAVVGMPIIKDGKLFDSAVVVSNGNIQSVIYKSCIDEHSQKRYFSCGNKVKNNEDFSVVIGNDFSNVMHNKIVLNPTAICGTVTSEIKLKKAVCDISKEKNCVIAVSNPGPTESTQDEVYTGHCIIAQNGKILAENKPFDNNTIIYADINLSEQKHNNEPNKYNDVRDVSEVESNPFIPSDYNEMDRRAEQILKIQSYGLKRRIEHTKTKSIVIGISGGLDSTLALLASVRTMDLLKRSRKDIIAITMPCFGTSERTKTNAYALCKSLGVTLKVIPVKESVTQHFKDIGHGENEFDVTFENAQARERTQVLMDVANMMNGLVVGTGDLSELALGWATYNGDHMSMYSVNADIPKTVIRYVVKYEAKRIGGLLYDTLVDIIDTPVSPELLPADDKGEIAQKTEDLVGPYELHDFFLYYFVHDGLTPTEIFILAKKAFDKRYSDETIIKWLEIFIRRFFTQQFKRSCMPDGPKIGSVGLSPRGVWCMPTDASYRLWQNDIEHLKKSQFL